MRQSAGGAWRRRILEYSALPPALTAPSSLTELGQDSCACVITAVMDADGEERLRASLEALNAAGIPTVVVETDFAATRPSHLSVTAGQVVEVVDRTNSSWWKVSNENGEGFVPTGCLSDVGASVDALMHDIHVHMNAADQAYAEIEHHEQLQAAIDAEHGRVQAEIDRHLVSLSVAGADHELRLPESAPAGFHYFKPPHRHSQGTVVTSAQLYDAVPHLTAGTMVCNYRTYGHIAAHACPLFSLVLVLPAWLPACLTGLPHCCRRELGCP